MAILVSALLKSPSAYGYLNQDSFLEKPTAYQELQKKVQGLLNQPEKLREAVEKAVKAVLGNSSITGRTQGCRLS